MGKKSGSGNGMHKQGSYFLELRNNFLGYKYSNSLIQIRDGNNTDPGSEINIPDPQHYVALVQKICQLTFAPRFVSHRSDREKLKAPLNSIFILSKIML
jgi:hypothetical protein